jgi:3-(3-hydroxy-phenyl)propionate hydroxylase
VNSGRLSLPSTYRDTPLSTPDRDVFTAGPPPGAPAIDAAMEDEAWLLGQCCDGFTLLAFGEDPALPAALQDRIAIRRLPAGGLAAQRYGAVPGSAYLLRPDQHVAARWHRPSSQDISMAYDRALARSA